MKIKLLLKTSASYRKVGKKTSIPVTVLEIEEILSEYIEPLKITLLPEEVYDTRSFQISGETNKPLRELQKLIEDDCRAKSYYPKTVEYTEIQTTAQDINPSKRRKL